MSNKEKAENSPDFEYDSDSEPMFFDENMGSESEESEHKFEYEVLSIEQVIKQMQQLIEQVKAVVSLPSTVIRTLLKYFKWDTQRVLERLIDGNREKLYKETGIVFSEDSIQTNPSKKRKYKSDPECDECMICFSKVDLSQMFGLDCKHHYCKQCWNQYLTTKIMSEGNVNSITCAHTTCKVVIDDEQVLQLVKEQLVKSKYQRLTTNFYVESNELLRWCPKPGCLHIFSAKSKEARLVICICRTKICFGCGEANHEPIECELIRQWNKKSAGDDVQRIDGKTANWIISNTKECPKCRTSIEKNGGCNHMTCRSIRCKFEFCWVCLESWSTHGTSYYNCNRYNAAKAQEVKESQSEQRKSLEKFMFYWTRYANHKQSLKFENELHSSVTTKMAKMQDKLDLTWVEVQFMKKAVDVLCICRQTLMNTYIFAYYNQSTTQLNIFEDNQRDLQRAVERLSEYLEQEIDKDMDKNIKPKVIDLISYCNKRRKALISHITEGYENEWWTYSFK